ncbi:MAG: RdgB/HAM1 family non-canonical purine NTP pyrophosphatase [Acidobacteriia bacterium]|nr:RdgB/HAM1 family non-canonical purine NTP pyrophosphatase [Terriglobia bacterium]
MIRLYGATGNEGKVREFRLAAQERPDIEIGQLPGFAQIPPCVEDGATFEENAILKARHYGARAPGLVFADDSGLECDALGGAPGIYSARFGGLHASDATNNRVLLETLEHVEPRTARFVCVIALIDGARLCGVFRGTVQGLIARKPMGSSGFGYDPLFFFPPFARTFGQVSMKRKLTVSHRGEAMRALLASL